MPRMFNFCSSVTILYSDKFQFLFLRNILEFWRNFNFCSSVILRKLRFCVGAVRESMMWLVNRVLGAVDMWEAVGGCGRGGCGRGGGHRAQHRPDRKQTNRRSSKTRTQTGLGRKRAQDANGPNWEQQGPV